MEQMYKDLRTIHKMSFAQTKLLASLSAQLRKDWDNNQTSIPVCKSILALLQPYGFQLWRYHVTNGVWAVLIVNGNIQYTLFYTEYSKAISF